MKYCTKCGQQIPDEAQFCPKCGANQDFADPFNQNNNNQNFNQQSNNNYRRPEPGSYSANLKSVALIFMILGTIVNTLLALIPLAWCLPMTLHYNQCIKEGRPVSVAFKVCSLIFCSLIAGILMLCDNDNQQ